MVIKKDCVSVNNDSSTFCKVGIIVLLIISNFNQVYMPSKLTPATFARLVATILLIISNFAYVISTFLLFIGNQSS